MTMVYINAGLDGVSGLSFPHLDQVIFLGTKKARLSNTGSYDMHWNLHICRVSVREYLPNPVFLFQHFCSLIEQKQT
jgi:hypothetical protein